MPSLDLVIQAKGGPVRDFSGTVDSGTSSTVLSMEAAARLGLGSDDLHEAGRVTVADGKQVPCFTATVPIAGQVLLVSDGVVRGLWGPSFYINAVFMENASPLWGQSDFFDCFEITFKRPEFTLSYDQIEETMDYSPVPGVAVADFPA